MAYVNVLEWRAQQVAEWLQGLDDSIYPYAHSFLNNDVTGKELLNITVDDLYKLQVEKVGHQEIILEALEHLRNLHHNLDTENLQYVCLKLSCKARSLCNEIRMYGPDPAKDKQTVDSVTACLVADVMDALWTLISWLDRPPFKGKILASHKEDLMTKGMELATITSRNTFAIKPINMIRDCCDILANLADSLIRDIEDPLILQPASLDIATVKRKPNDDSMDFGIVLTPLPLNGVHLVQEVRFQSPAHQCARVQPGDEVVQINYLTVVGWNIKKIMQLMDENPSELIVTLKKRPRHLPVYGQIYIKPFRIPARTHKKGSTTFNNLPSPRAELLVAPNITMKHLRSTKPEVEQVDVESVRALSLEGEDSSEEDNEDAFTAVSVSSIGSAGGGSVTGLSPNKSPTQSVRSLLSRPRSTPQRRATISGSSPSLSRPYINITEIWSCQARNIHSVDHSGRSCSSNSSTLQSNDSGNATLSTSPTEESAELRPKGFKYLPRPMTVGGIPSPKIVPPTITTTDCSSEPKQPQSLDNSMVSSPTSSKTPMPKPRTQLSSGSLVTSPNRKKPIPQPRSAVKAPQKNSMMLKTLLPDKPQVPKPTSEFQSFVRIQKQAKLPEYVNTTPPEVPARNKGQTRRPSELLQQSKKPSSRRFSGDFSEAPPPIPPPPSNPIVSPLSAPYCVTDLLPPGPPPPGGSGGPDLPPVFTPQTYNLQEMHQRRSSSRFKMPAANDP